MGPRISEGVDGERWDGLVFAVFSDGMHGSVEYHHPARYHTTCYKAIYSSQLTICFPLDIRLDLLALDKGVNSLHALALAGRSGGLVLVLLAFFVLDDSLRALVSV